MYCTCERLLQSCTVLWHREVLKQTSRGHPANSTQHSTKLHSSLTSRSVKTNIKRSSSIELAKNPRNTEEHGNIAGTMGLLQMVTCHNRKLKPSYSQIMPTPSQFYTLWKWILHRQIQRENYTIPTHSIALSQQWHYKALSSQLAIVN